MKHSATTIQVLKTRITELIREKPEKAVIILTEWLKQTPDTKKSLKKAA